MTAGKDQAGADRLARSPSGAPVRDTFVGGAWILLADGLFIPIALLVTTFLARRLGPFQYGLYVLAAGVAGWLEWVLASVVSRAAVRQIAASEDWRPAGTAILHVLLALGCGAGLLLWVAATPVGRLLGEASLGPLLRLSVPSLPLIGLALAHRFVLVGLGRFQVRAFVSILRSLCRLALVVVLVEAGFGVAGAVAAAIGAAAAEVVAARCFVRLPLGGAGPTPWRELGRLAGPLFLAGISMRAFERADLFCLQAVSGHTADTGTFGAAQNLATLPSFIMAAFAPVLLASVTRLTVAGRGDDARELARQALRGTLWLAPLAAAVAGAAGPIVLLLFGPQYRPAGPLLAILCVGSVAQVILVVASTVLVAIGRIKTSAALAVPLVPVAVAAHLIVIPRFGATGAAVVTSTVSCLGAGAALLALGRAMRVRPSAATVGRIGALTLFAAVLAAVLPGEGVLVVARMMGVLALVAVALVLSGEARLSELRALVAPPGGATRNR